MGTTTTRPLHLTQLRKKILRLISVYEIVLIADLSLYIYGDTEHHHKTIINREVVFLEEMGLVHRRIYDPENFEGRGLRPNLIFLSHAGAEYAQEHWPETYPHPFFKDRSNKDFEHDHKRSQTHRAIDVWCQANGLSLGWKKGRYGKEDDLFEITKTKAAHFINEEENKRKSFQALYDKFKPFVSLYGTAQAKELFGFKYYSVTIPMRNKEAVTNVLIHFKGSCDCTDQKLKFLHRNAPFKLITDILLFTTHEDITKRTGEKILHSTDGNAQSFMDIVS